MARPRVYVAGNRNPYHVGVWVSPNESTILRPRDDGWDHEAVDPQVDVPPSFWLPMGLEQDFVEAFVGYAQSVDGYVPSEQRNDYLDERRRVDKLTDALIAITTRGA